MSTLLERLREESKQLSLEDRLLLGEELLADDDPAVEEAWDEEILRRVEEIKSGKVKMIPMEEVFGTIDTMLSCTKR